MIASILIPSRHRPNGLIRAIGSLLRSASGQHQIEFIVRIDDDDLETIGRLSEVKAFPNTTVLIGPRKLIQDLLVECANLATGAWVISFNDDAWLEGLNWDEQLAQCPTSGFIFQPEIYDLNGSEYKDCEHTGFPFFPNGCWKEWGHPDFIPPPTDTAVFVMSRQRQWKVKYLKGVTIHHDRHADSTLPVA